jgi:anti-repressor protein
MDIQIFKENGWEVRTITKDGEPWFVAKDVCTALGFLNSRDAVNNHLDDDEKGVVSADTQGGKQNLRSVNESGLYALIFKSVKPEARQFRKWVTSKVLPEIRKTGGYLHTTPEDTPDTIIARALLMADQKIKKLELTVIKAAPAVDFRNYATKKGTQWTITDAKNELEISLADLQEELSVFGFFRLKKMVRNNRLWPKDKFIDCGYCVEVHDGPNYAFTCKGMEFVRTLICDGIVRAEAMFELDRQPDLFEEE